MSAILSSKLLDEFFTGTNKAVSINITIRWARTGTDMSPKPDVFHGMEVSALKKNIGVTDLAFNIKLLENNEKLVYSAHNKKTLSKCCI